MLTETTLTEPDTLLTTTGLLIIAVTVGLLIWGRVAPIVAMVVVPVVGALAIGFDLSELQEFFAGGLSSVMNVVVMFIFAIIFFSILSDAGLFDPLIRTLILMTRGRVVLVCIGTVLIGAIAHLDGAGATTFLLTIPALLPLYKALNMSKYLLLLLISLSASIMNMVPWGGPLGRAAAVTEIDPVELYQPLMVVQGIGLVLLLTLATLLGLREIRRIDKGVEAGEFEAVGNIDVHQVADDFTKRQIEARAHVEDKINRNRIVFWLNVLLVAIVLTVMLAGWLPPALTFLIGVAVALPLNFSQAKTQMDQLKEYAPNALMMAAVIISAAVFLGVLNESGMLESIALSLLGVIPAAVGPYLHLIVGAFGVPLDVLTSTDAYYFSVLPLVDATASQFGVPTASTAYALMIGNIIGTFVSPYAPAMWLALGLAGANVGKHIRYSFGIMWAFSIVLLLVAVLVGVVEV
ncbi:CitMHS family citrate-Mg2+:H+ or citrate-Ca2+:H+ symporter [Kineosphaera limosa]|uniref:Putative citrate transporter n=1 Tax=Kineosphaera limosa NBRC 100340 TaxID=1184609 RepID=K6WS86_9MICO|nr:citrate:proton symporter [Kineosphaera limosa]NYE00577.1 CitMHS family citrate-Mg2+:H+ or citrate-Ca2+:H+ symporter [Kineosphaera limosa]GAB94957.1 putative citrate transporter [Kineosphaera limosa NBRC 100340]